MRSHAPLRPLPPINFEALSLLMFSQLKSLSSQNRCVVRVEIGSPVQLVPTPRLQFVDEFTHSDH